MSEHIGKTIEYQNKYGETVTAAVARVEKLLYPAGATGLVHMVDGKEEVVVWRPGIIKN